MAVAAFRAPAFRRATGAAAMEGVEHDNPDAPNQLFLPLVLTLALLEALGSMASSSPLS